MVYPLNAPLFDLLVLSIVNQNDAYGYQISQVIKTASSTKDSTLYPILKRLQERNCLETYDQQYQGRNRKYYSITNHGEEYRQELMDEWEQFNTAINRIVKGGLEDE